MKKRILSIVLTLCMALTLLPVTAEAGTNAITLNIANGGVTVSKKNSYFLIKQGAGEEQTLPFDGVLTITGTAGAQDAPSGNNVTVNIPGQTLNMVVKDLNHIADKNCIDIQAGSVSMTLEGESKIKSHDMNKSALHIAENASLTVTQESTGSIDVRFTDTNGWTTWSAALGGDRGGCMGSLTVAGGTVVADCPGGTGIGNGNDTYRATATGTVTVTGGKVYASSWSASGLGGRSGEAAPLASLTVSGGTVRASSGEKQAMAVTPDTSGYNAPHLTVGWENDVPTACEVANHVSYKTFTITDHWVEVADTDWYDASENSFTLTTPFQLAGMAALSSQSTDPVDFSGKTVALGADIDLTGALWTPIAKFSNGTFDGRGHTVSSMNALELLDSRYAGLFAELDGNRTVVKNLMLSGSINTACSGSAASIGALAGKANGNVHIENVHTDVAITAAANGKKANVGGLVGDFAYNPKTILNCSAVGNITLTGGRGDYSFVGGLVGKMMGSTLSNSFYNGNISAQAEQLNVGGLAGYGGSFASIDNCYAAGSITATGSSYLWKGSLVGSIDRCSVNNSHYTGDEAFGHGTNTVNNARVSAFDPAADAQTLLTALNANAGDKGSGTFYTPWRIDTSATSPKNDGLPYHASYWKFNKADVSTISGSGSQADPYLIDTGAKLAALCDLGNLSGKYIRLNADIDLSAHIWTPLEDFDGVEFDGNNKTVSGMEVWEAVDSGSGLFAGIGSDAIIKDLTLSGSITLLGGDPYSVGGLFGGTSSNVHVENVHTNVTIDVDTDAQAVIGGIAGCLTRAYETIINCSATGDITLTGTGGADNAYSCVGGLIGTVKESAIENSFYNGTI